MSRKLPYLLGIMMVLFFLAVPQFAGSYWKYILTLIFIYSIVTVGLDILVGYTGQISVGAAGFFALGAYFSTLLVINLGIPILVSIIFGGIFAGIIGWLVGFPALKLNPIYIAAGTFGFGQLVNLIILHWETVTNGSDGLRLPRMFASSGSGTYYLAFILAILLILAGYNLIHSKIGRAFVAIRESQVAAFSLGVNVPHFKTVAFAISSFYAGIAGGLVGQLDGFISPDSFTVITSILFLTMIIVGGVGTITGAILGTMLLTGLAQASLGYGQFSEIIFGVVLLLSLLFMPKGLASKCPKLTEWLSPLSHMSGPMTVESGSIGDIKYLGRGKPFAPENTMTDSLEIKNISIAFGGLRAIDDFSLTVFPKKIHGIIGPNGAGKTTLFNIITGIYNPDQGKVIWKGKNIINYPPDQICRAGISRTYQNLEIFEEMTVLENLLVGMHLQQKAGIIRSALKSNLSRSEEKAVRDRAIDLLRFSGLYPLAAVKAYELAFWQKRRLELARALAANPSMLLLDEPASGLSKEEIQELKDILLVLHQSCGLTIVMIEHVMELAMNICDTITVMQEGRKIAEGIPETIKKDETVLNAYLGSGDLDGNFKFS